MSTIQDAAMQRAVARRKELEEEIKKIDIFLSMYQEFASGEGTPLVMPASPAETSSLVSAASPKERRTRSGRSVGMAHEAFVQFVRNILLAHGRPMQRDEILEKFHEKGRNIGGADEVTNLKSKLWRAQAEIARIPGAGFWPTDVPCPAVSYEPVQEQQRPWVADVKEMLTNPKQG
jgi:hypothetical protein